MGQDVEILSESIGHGVDHVVSFFELVGSQVSGR